MNIINLTLTSVSWEYTDFLNALFDRRPSFVQRPLGDVTYFSSSRTPWSHISVSLTKSTMVDYCNI